MREKGDNMKRGSGAGSARTKPDWKLLEETAIRIEFSLDDIIRRDSLRLASPGFTDGRLAHEYAVSVSTSIAGILQAENPSERVQSTQLSGDRFAVNTLTCGGVQVVIRHTRPPEMGLSVMVLGEGDAQKNAAERIRALKKSLEG